jgi:hypothetical protein
MNDQIIKTLVDDYSQKGVSMHELLGDPLFKELPLDKQVEAVQTYAKVIHQGSQAPSSFKLIAKSILRGIFGGALIAIPLALSKPKIEQKIVYQIAGLGAGAVFGGMAGVLEARQQKRHHETLNKYLIRIKDNDVDNAVKVLQTNSIRRPDGHSMIGKIVDPGPVGRPIDYGMKLLDLAWNKIDNYSTKHSGSQASAAVKLLTKPI